MKKLIVTCAVALATVVKALAADTLVWNGPTSGGTWEDSANWTTTSSETVADLLNTATIYDFTKLGNGATVTYSRNQLLLLGGLRFGANQGTVTLAVNAYYCRFVGEQSFTGGIGTTVNLEMRQYEDPSDSNQRVTLGGGAIFNFLASDQFVPANKWFEIGDATTLRFVAPTPNFYLADIVWNDSDSRLELEANMSIRYIVGYAALGTLDLGGYDLTVTGSGSFNYPSGRVEGAVPFGATIVGAGNVTLSGNDTNRWLSAPTFNGDLILQGGMLQLSGCSLGGNQNLKTGGGVLSAADDVTVKTLAGTGATGGVAFTGTGTKTLAVTGGDGVAATTFGSRITGNGALEKSGADYTLALTGTNDYTGATHVKAGTLAAKRPAAPGLVGHWSFDDWNDVGKDYGIYGLNGATGAVAYANCPISGFTSIEGVRGKGLQFEDNTWFINDYFQVAGATAANGMPCGDQPVTYSLWVKPATSFDGQVHMGTGPVFLLRRGAWGDGTQSVIWLLSGPTVVWSIANWEFGGANSVAAQCPDLLDQNWHQIVCTYENRCLKLYYDGRLTNVLEQTGSVLSIADGALIQLGANGDDYNSVSQNRYAGGVDELKVYNRALTADEVAADYDARAAWFADDPAGSVLPVTTTVTVDAGAAFDVSGFGHTVAGLDGGGTVTVNGVSKLAVTNSFALTGALTGSGDVVVSGLTPGANGAAFTGTFTIAEKAHIEVADANKAVNTLVLGGRLVLPKEATVTWAHGTNGGRYVLAKAASIEVPDGGLQWTDKSGSPLKNLTVVAGDTSSELRLTIDTGTFLCVR